MKKIIKNEKGITLIALITSVIVLIILAGISVGLTIGQNGILQRAGDTQVKQDWSEVSDAITNKITEYDLKNRGNDDGNTDVQRLKNDGYIDANGIVDVKKIVGTELKTGKGSNKKDVYILENNELCYYNNKSERNVIITLDHDILE